MSRPMLHRPPAAQRRNLFTPPPDLVCPITHDLFSDPVATAAGQVPHRQLAHPRLCCAL